MPLAVFCFIRAFNFTKILSYSQFMQQIAHHCQAWEAVIQQCRLDNIRKAWMWIVIYQLPYSVVMLSVAMDCCCFILCELSSITTYLDVRVKLVISISVICSRKWLVSWSSIIHRITNNMTFPKVGKLSDGISVLLGRKYSLHQFLRRRIVTY